MESKSPKDTKKISIKFSKLIKKGATIFLYGEIGAGKTTFVRFLINHLEVENNIKKSDILSPTFNIVYDYSIKRLKIFHYDLYRLKNYNDISELGIFEDSKNHIRIIEWPELIKPKPKDRIDITFSYLIKSKSRKIKITGLGKYKNCKFDEI